MTEQEFMELSSDEVLKLTEDLDDPEQTVLCMLSDKWTYDEIGHSLDMTIDEVGAAIAEGLRLIDAEMVEPEIRLTEDARNALKGFAEKRGVTPEELAREIVTDFVKKEIEKEQ